MKRHSVVGKLHLTCIRNTKPKELVKVKTVLVTEVTKVVQEVLQLKSNRVYLTSIALKHIYDNRDPMEYDFIIHNMRNVIRFPEEIFVNLKEKRGDFCFVGTVKGVTLTVSLEEQEGEGEKVQGNYVVTSFRTKKKKNYYRDYTSMWRWEDGTPPSLHV